MGHLHSRQQDRLRFHLRDQSITAIDVQAMKELTRIPVHEMPDRISTLVLP